MLPRTKSLYCRFRFPFLTKKKSQRISEGQMTSRGAAKSTSPSKSTFQGRRHISPAWFKELCKKEEHLWKEDWEGDIASGPLTEPFPRRRPTDITSPSPNKGSPLGWNFDQVSMWLKQVGLSRYIKVFRKHMVSGPALLSMRAEHLEVLEMSDKDQCVFLTEINKLNKEIKMKSLNSRRKQNIQTVKRLQRRIRDRDSRNKFVRTLNTEIRNVEKDRRGIVWIKSSSSSSSSSEEKTNGKSVRSSSDDSGDVLPPRWNRKSDGNLKRRAKTLNSSKIKKENDLLVSRMKRLFESHRLKFSSSNKKSSSKTSRPFFYMRQK